MNVLICASGTLGHINPAINIANELQKNNHNIFFLTLLKNDININNVTVIKIKGEGFDRKNLLSNFRNIKNYFISISKIKQILKENKIDLVISFGSVAGTLGMVAKGKNKKVKGIVHEQNAVFGFGNKIARLYADKVLLTYKNNEKGIVVGNPVSVNNDNYYCYNKQRNVLITCGTNGAKRINDFFVKNIDLLLNNSDYSFTLITGDKYYDNNKEIFQNKVNKRFKILPKQNGLSEIFNENNIVICRSGSTTLHEVLGLNKLIITIPSPNVVNNHQFENANYYYKKGCLELINENELDVKGLLQLFDIMIKNKYLYYENIKKNYINNSIELFKKEINSLMGNNNG